MANGVVELLMLLKKLLQKNYRLLKSCLQQLYLNKIITQLLHLVFMFTPAANLVTDEFLCQRDEFKSQSEEFNSQRDEFICQWDGVNRQKDEFNCQTCNYTDPQAGHLSYAYHIVTYIHMHFSIAIAAPTNSNVYSSSPNIRRALKSDAFSLKLK